LKNAEVLMDPVEIIHHLENCYDAMVPAFEKSDRAFVWISHFPHPFFNSIMRLSCQGDVGVEVDRLIAQVPPEVPFSFWVHSQNRSEGLIEALLERDFVSGITCPVMIWDVERVKLPQFEVCPADMEIFHEISAVTSEFDETLKKAFEKLIQNIDCENYLVYSEDKAVGTGMLFQNGPIGGIFNISTLPEYQKKGYGKATMLFLMNRALELGLEHLLLLSSPVATKLYTDLGFKKAFDVEIFFQTNK
jgi:N-acetylglutamate synthase-like GNAT family acetyltransferase